MLRGAQSLRHDGPARRPRLQRGGAIQHLARSLLAPPRKETPPGAAYGKSGGKPSQHLYGPLIQVSNELKRVHNCLGYWHDVVQERFMMPNEFVLGCMLDALVCNGEVPCLAGRFEVLALRRGGREALPRKNACCPSQCTAP